MIIHICNPVRNSFLVRSEKRSGSGSQTDPKRIPDPDPKRIRKNGSKADPKRIRVLSTLSWTWFSVVFYDSSYVSATISVATSVSATCKLAPVQHCGVPFFPPYQKHSERFQDRVVLLVSSDVKVRNGFKTNISANAFNFFSFPPVPGQQIRNENVLVFVKTISPALSSCFCPLVCSTWPRSVSCFAPLSSPLAHGSLCSMSTAFSNWCQMHVFFMKQCSFSASLVSLHSSGASPPSLSGHPLHQ